MVRLLLLKSSFFMSFIYLEGVTSSSTPIKGPRKGPHMQLTEQLLQDYASTFNRPVSDYHKTVQVEFFFFVDHILNFDERNQMLTVSGSYYISWHDEYLRWNTSGFSSIEDVVIAMSQIWHPDINLYDSSDIEMPPLLLATLYPNGQVQVVFPVVFSIFCRLDARFFPFDTQRCQLRFGSWIYPERRMNISLPSNEYILEEHDHIANGVWDLSVQFHRDVTHYEGFDSYPEIVFTLLLTRRPTFFVLTVIIPCSFLSLTNIMVFVLPTESGEKVSLGITNVLALVLFQQLISGILPPTSDNAPFISYYFTPMIITGCLAVVTGAIVANLHQKDETSKIPNWLTTLVKKRQKKHLSAKKNGNVKHEFGDCDIRACDKMRNGVDESGDMTSKSVIKSDDDVVTWKDVASALNSIMLAVCLLITIISATAIIFCFSFMYV